MSEFHERVNQLVQKGEAFATAVVVSTQGSTSAKPGAKSIVSAEGKSLWGWIGGGCAEATVAEEALEALRQGSPRMVHIDLEDEVKGGMPCGGSMQVYVEPYLSRPRLVILGHGAIAEALCEIGSVLGYSTTVSDPLATKERFPRAELILADDPDFEKTEIHEGSMVVVATQHKSDDRALLVALRARAPYIALVASRKRSGIVLQTLLEKGIPKEELARIRAPAGLDIGALDPQEIALSIMAEIVALRRGGTGRPKLELKGSEEGGLLEKIRGQVTGP